MVKVIIAGTRTFDDYELLRRTVCELFGSIPASQMEIVSGHCPSGADLLGEKFAMQNHMKLTLFPAEWNTYGKAAGPIRNKQMAEYASPDGYCIVFWDGKSRGSQSMIAEASKVGIGTKIIMYSQNQTEAR